jgi:hypothetical protein
MLEGMLGKTEYETKGWQGEQAYRERYAHLRRRDRVPAVWKMLLAFLARFY